MVGSNPTHARSENLKVARLKTQGRKVQDNQGSKMHDRKEESPVRRGGECLHESYVSLFLISDLWSFLSGRIHFLTLAVLFLCASLRADEETPCFEAIACVDKAHGGWMTVKRTNVDSCEFAPATTIILTTFKPIVRKTEHGYEITFAEKL